jgi:hypothetical protein
MVKKEKRKKKKNCGLVLICCLSCCFGRSCCFDFFVLFCFFHSLHSSWHAIFFPPSRSHPLAIFVSPRFEPSLVTRAAALLLAHRTGNDPFPGRAIGGHCPATLGAPGGF